ncbi:MAG TPA: hypothetical protein PKW35_21680 [Nannocystaceae bacterium]|nr:hypothetical protein [Nannocystaceae bacterium]
MSSVALPHPERIRSALASTSALALLALLAAAPACSGGASDTDTDGSATGTGSSTGSDTAADTDGDAAILVGTFEVELIGPSDTAPGQTAVLGKIYDGPSLSQIIWEEAAVDGACHLVTPRVPFCSTPCGGSAACVEDETCKDYPVAHGAGEVTMKGLGLEGGGDEFSMNPLNNAYQPVGVGLLYPAFAEGDTITLDAAGDYFPAFSITATGIAPFELTSGALALEGGKAANLTWTPGASPGAADIHVKLDISHHGGTKGMIECDTDDSGSLEISAALVQQLLDLGVAGFPTVIVSRSSVGSTTIPPGRVDLVITSAVEAVVQVPGLTSCTADADCPDGETCQVDLSCK